MKSCFRILVTGKTGGGKSSFCNYLAGQEVFKTGVGAPVTGWEDNFQESSIENENFDLRFVDTVGIEPDNFKKWSKEIKKYAGKESQTKSSNDWVHGIFHVVNASAARYEPIDGDTIELLQQRFPASPLQVILTHVDRADEDQVIEIEARLKALNVPVHQVSSVTKRFRNGNSVEPKGKEEVVKEFYELTSSSIFVRYKLLQVKLIRRQVISQFKKMKMAASAEQNKILEMLFSSYKKKRLQTISSALKFEVTFDKEQEHAYSSFIELLDPEFSDQLKKGSVRERFALSKLVERIENEVAEVLYDIQRELGGAMPKSSDLLKQSLALAFPLSYLLKLFDHRDFRAILEHTEGSVLNSIECFKQELLSLDKKAIYNEERFRSDEQLNNLRSQSKLIRRRLLEMMNKTNAFKES